MGNTELPPRGGSTGAALAGNTEVFPQTQRGDATGGEEFKGKCRGTTEGLVGQKP